MRKYNNFEGGPCAKKTAIVWSKFYKKGLKRLLWPVFSKICLLRRNFDQNGVFIRIGDSSKNQFGRPKRKVDKMYTA